MNLSKGIKEKLTLVKESDHFIVHYAMRNPRLGRGLGPHGVRDESLIDTYLVSLEKLYQTMISPPWNRDPPVVGPGGKTHVYVYNSGFPFMTCDLAKVPYIVLTSRNSEPTVDAELKRAASEAVHEATHLFNFTKRPLYDKFNATRWEWFDEGLAVLMEMLVTEDNQDHHRLLIDWIDSPEMSLDHPAGIYHVGMFIRYVGEYRGFEFVNDIWLESYPEEEPLQTLLRLTPEDEESFFSDLGVAGLFAGYSFDPYFLKEHAYELFMRFGERAVSESLSLPDALGAKITDHLDHLSCRYYRVFLEEGVSGFTITVKVGDGAPLKAKAAIVTTDKNKQLLEPLSVQSDGSLSLTLSELDAAEIDHIVLVISNCGTNTPWNGTAVNHDAQEFTILIQEASNLIHAEEGTLDQDIHAV